MWRSISVILCCALLAGCALFQPEPEKIQMTVNRFHRDDFFNRGDTFIIVPKGDQKSDLEFDVYAHEIRSMLIRSGWRSVSRISQARYAVSFSYGVSKGENIVHSKPIYDWVGGGRTVIKDKTTHHKVVVDKDADYRIVGTKTYTTTVYSKWLNLDIVDLKKGTKSTPYRVFQGRSVTKGPRSTFTEVHNCLIWSLLYNNFPGKQGDDHVWFYANKGDGIWYHRCVS